MQVQGENAPTAAPAASSRPDRASILSEMATLGSDPPAEKPAPEPEKPADPPPAKEAPAEEPVADDDETEDEDQPAAAEADPDMAKRLEAIQKREAKTKEGLDAYRRKLDAEHADRVTAFEKERSEWAPKVERLKEIEKRIQYGAFGDLLEMFGVPEDRYEDVARDVYSKSPKAKADPRHREAVQRTARERELQDKLDRIEKQVEADRAERLARESQAEMQQYVAGFIERAAKAVDPAEAPLVAKMLAKNPASAKVRLAKIAQRLSEQTDEEPEPADVVRALEKLRRDELAELDIDFSAAPTAANPKNKTPAAGEKKRPMTLSNDLGTPTQPRSAPLKRAEQQEEILLAMREGRLD